MEFNMDDTFGARLRKVRKKFGLTQKAFGEKIGVSLPTVNRLEQSDGWPHEDFLLKLRSEFDCDPTWLLTGKASDGSGLRLDVVRNRRIFDLLQAQRADWMELVACTEKVSLVESEEDRRESEGRIKGYRDGIAYINALLEVGADDLPMEK
jgi:transcriptional regulator with XRE-family HTH domain